MPPHVQVDAVSVLRRCRACQRDQLPDCAFSTKQLRAIGKQPGKEPLCLACAEYFKSEEKVRLQAIEVDVLSGWVVGGRVATAAAAQQARCLLHVSDSSMLPTGVRYFPAFLTESDERRIMEIVDSRRWSTVFRRRQQFYGEIYYHTSGAVPAVQPVIGDSSFGAAAAEGGTKQCDESAPTHDISSFEWLAERFFSPHFAGMDAIFGDDRSSFPTQILVNEYLGNAGIASHFEDEEAFGPVIATISLLAPIYMTLEKPREKNNACDDIVRSSKLLLEPRSMMIMSGESRFDFRHCITRHMDVYLPSGEVVKRRAGYRRVSLTIRHLLPGRRQVATAATVGPVTSERHADNAATAPDASGG